MKELKRFSRQWKMRLLFFPVVGSCAVAQVTIDIPASIKSFRATQESAGSVIVVYRDDAGLSKKGTKGKSYKSLEAPGKVVKSAARNKKGAVGPSKAAKHLDNMYVANVRPGVSIADALAEVQQDPDVLYVEPNGRVQAFSMPNDPYYNNLYALNNTGQVVKALSLTGLVDRIGTVDADMDWLEAWNNGDFPTNEIVVAVIDTGVDYTHPDIANQLWHNPGETLNGIDDDANGVIDDIYGADVVNQDGDPKDDNGHGSHVAGIIAAEGHNSLGIIGVNPYAKIMAVKFLGADGSGAFADAIECIVYAVNNGAKILNNSWGGGAWSQALQDAVDYAVENGAVFMAAAGNSNTSLPSYPAAYNGVIAVASLDCDDGRSPFSNYGSWVDVAAHGSDILSIRAEGTSLTSPYVYETNYVVFQGTSMACPNAVGAMSLLVSAYPGASPYIYERILELTADSGIYTVDANTNYVGRLGAGRINIDRMLHEEVNAGYISANWAAPVDDAKAGYTNELLASVGIWSSSMSNLTVTATNLSSGIAVSTNLYTIGDLTTFGTYDIPSNTFVVTVSPTATNEYETVQLVFRSGTNVLHTATRTLFLFQGNAVLLNVDDLDADGTNDIVSVYGSYIMRYAADGTMQWYAEPIIGGGIQAFTSLASGDLDDDGMKEVVALAENFFGSSDQTAPSIHVYRQDGMVQEGFPLEDWNSFTEPALADVDEDGMDEIITVTGKGFGKEPVLKVFKGNGSLLWSLPLNHIQAAPVSAGDFDGDGYPEIAVCSYNNVWYEGDTSTVCVVDGDGTLMAEWGVPDGFTIMGDVGSPYAPISLGDLDGDGTPEIVMAVTKDGINTTNQLYAWHADGSVVTGWPKELKDTVRFYDTPVLADINGDAKPEVFSTHYWNEVEGFNPNGTPLPGFPMAYTNGYPTLRVDDLDGDGSGELLLTGWQTYADKLFAYHAANGQAVAGWDPYVIDDDDPVGINDIVFCNLGSNDHGQLTVAVGTKLHIIDTGATYTPMERGWPMHRQNPQRTGLCDGNTSQLFRCSFDVPQRYGISNLTASFTAYPFGFDATNSWYSWDFDNNGTPDYTVLGVSTAAHTYASIGDFDVSLTISNAAGRTFTRPRKKYIHVLAPVVADFTVNLTTGEAPVTLQFTDLSQNEPCSWYWDFGDYNTSTNQNPEHYYTDSGTFTVTLTVQNDFGAAGRSSNTLVKTAYITLTNDASTMVKYVSKDGLSLYPYKNWREAATNLQDAIDATLGGQTVLVTNGMYICGEAPDYEYTIERNNITLRSVNGPEQTVIQGRGLAFGNRFSALYINGATGTVVDGFTLEQGTCEQGGGISCENADRTRIENCIFRDNSSAEASMSGGYGGGMWATRNVTIRNSLFERNAAYRGAGLFLVTDSLTQTALVENCVFRDNGGDFRSQLGSAIAVDGTSIGKHIIRNCQITGNTGRYSIVYSQPAIELDGCTIADNRTLDSGSGILQTHNVYHGEALNATSGTWTVRNTILAPNEGVAFYTTGGPTINFSYSCFTSTVSGPGNIVADPQFVSLPGDYHLSPGSSCRDAGQHQSWMNSTNDLYGDSPRIVNSTVDMGCDEFVLGATVSATPVSGAPPLDVSFTSTVTSVLGTVTNYTWTFGDGAVSNGAALTAVHHIYTNELDRFIAVLTVQDSAGYSASNGVQIIIDSLGPHLTHAQAISSAKVRLDWDEVVTAVTATNFANYSVLSGFTVLDAELSTGNRSVTLTVTPAFTPGTTNQVQAIGVEDIYGNAISGVETQSFIYVDAATYGILVDIGYGFFKAEGNWNHINAKTVGDYVTNAVDAAGHVTEVDIGINDAFPYMNYSDGVQVDDLYPTNAQMDGLYGTLADPGALEIRQLNPEVRYDLILFGSTRLATHSNYADTVFLAGGQTNGLNAFMNTSNTANFYSLAPDANGTIAVTVSGDNSADYGFLNVMEIRRGSPILLLSTNQLVIPENTIEQIRARLSVTPDNAITVSVANASGDLDIQVVSASSMVFTPLNWDQEQTVSIRAGLDADWLNGTASVHFVSAEMPMVETTCIEADRDTNPAALLPFSETFENESPMAGTPGPVNNQHGWVSAESRAIVQSAVKHGGVQALEISNEEVWHPFVTTADVVNISFYAIPQYRIEPDSTASNVAVYFYIWTNGHVIAYSNTTPVELSVHVSDTTWSLFEVECDYAAQQWTLLINGTNVARGFGFYGPQSGLTRLELREGSETVSYLDDVSVAAVPDGDDADSDGLPDNWEAFYYGNTMPDPNDLAANGVNTLIQCYIAGLDPTDPTDRLLITSITKENLETILQWQNVTGRVYTVFWTTNIWSGFHILGTDYTGGAFTDVLHAAGQKGFYKLEVQLEP